MPRRSRRKSEKVDLLCEQVSVTPVKSGLLDLPNELLYLIRDFLPKENLRDHIALQATCCQVRTLYEKDERFWKAACHAYGVSRPAPSEEFPYTKSKVTWRQLAILIVNHQECCDVPSCRHWELPESIKEWGTTIRNPAEVYERRITYTGFATSIDLVCGIFHGIDSASGEDISTHVKTLGEESALILHSLGLCKFATTPPMQEIYINALGFRLLVKNFDGVTVWDVVERLDQFRWEHFSLSRFFITYQAFRGRIPSMDAFSWIDALTMGDVITYIRDILRDPGPIGSLAGLFAQLERYSPAFDLIEDEVPIFPLVIAVEDLFDRCRLKDLILYIGQRFPPLIQHEWYHLLLEYSPVETMLQQLIFQGLAPCRQTAEKFDGLELDALWGIY